MDEEELEDESLHFGAGADNLGWWNSGQVDLE